MTMAPRNQSEQITNLVSSELGNAEEHDLSAAHGSIAQAVNSFMVEAYWTIGKETAETMGDCAECARRLISYPPRNLTAKYGKGFSEANLRNMRQLYRAFPIRYTLSSELGWTHYRHIMRVESTEAREFYVSEYAASNWSEQKLRRRQGQLQQVPQGPRQGAWAEHVEVMDENRQELSAVGDAGNRGESCILT